VPQLRIEPLTDEGVRGFLAAYAPTPSLAEGLWQALEGSRQLALYRIPYYLRLLVDQAAAEGGVPRGRAALFSGFVRQALRREVNRRHHRLFDPSRGLLDPLDVLLDKRYQAGRVTRPYYWTDEAYNHPAQPVVGVCWHEAWAYCAWLSACNGRAFALPSEAQWEAAVRG
jgi:hypothetical protein